MGGKKASKIPVWPSNVHFYASDSNWKTFTMQLLVHEIPCGILIAIDELAGEMREEEQERWAENGKSVSQRSHSSREPCAL